MTILPPAAPGEGTGISDVRIDGTAATRWAYTPVRLADATEAGRQPRSRHVQAPVLRQPANPDARRLKEHRMKPLERIREFLTSNPAADEALYELVAREVADGRMRPGLWAKAMVDAAGDEAKAKARYLYIRMASLKAQQPQLKKVLKSLAEARQQHEAAEMGMDGNGG